MVCKEAGIQNVGRNKVTGDEAVQVKLGHIVKEIEQQFGNWEHGLWKKTLVQNQAVPLMGTSVVRSDSEPPNVSFSLSLKEELTILTL